MEAESPSSSRATPSWSRLSGKKLLLLLLSGLAATFAVVSLLVFTTPLARNELGLLGGLKITANEGAKIFVGDREVGITEVDVPWNELLGATQRDPLAIPLTATSAPSQNRASQATIEAVAGDNSTLLWSKSGITDVYRGEQKADYAYEEMLLRRADGSLDHVFVIDCLFAGQEGRWQRFVLPIRIRPTQEAEPIYFPKVIESGGGKGGRGMIPSRRDRNTFALTLKVAKGIAPEEFANELAEGPMWHPSP